MDALFDIKLISGGATTGQTLLSICYQAGWVVAELEGTQSVEQALALLAECRTKKTAQWLELGRFATCPVTLYIGSEVIGIIVDTDLTVDSFGQPAGMHIPRELLDEFAQALSEEHKRFCGRPPA